MEETTNTPIKNIIMLTAGLIIIVAWLVTLNTSGLLGEINNFVPEPNDDTAIFANIIGFLPLLIGSFLFGLGLIRAVRPDTATRGKIAIATAIVALLCLLTYRFALGIM